MRHPLRLLLLVLAATLLVLSGCRARGGLSLEALPTLASLDALATSLPLTENAPPPDFRGAVGYEQADANLRRLAGWRYEAALLFDGVASGTNRPLSAEVHASVSFNQLASARRVQFRSQGELLGQPDGASYEAVRLGPDAFLVREDGVCLIGADADAQAAADLGAGALVGGVTQAVPSGRRAVLNGAEAWLYTPDATALNLPALRFAEGGRIVAFRAELWVAPAHDAVVRYWATLEVENALLLTSRVPASGTLLLRYDLFDVGRAANITVPFGC